MDLSWNLIWDKNFSLLFLVFLPIFSFTYVSIKQSFLSAIIQFQNNIFYFYRLSIIFTFSFPNAFYAFYFYHYERCFFQNHKRKFILRYFTNPCNNNLKFYYSCDFTHFFCFTTDTSKWFINNFLSTQHPADHESINFFSWLNYFFTTWLGDYELLNISFVIFSCLIIFKGFYFYLRNHHLNKNNYSAYIVLFSGIITILTFY